MKRADLTVGQEVAFSRDTDWFASPHHITKVTVVDTRGWFARRYSGRAFDDIQLQDGTTVDGKFYAEDSTKATVLVRNAQGRVDLVPLSQLRGPWAECHKRAVETATAKRQREELLREHSAMNRQRVTAAAAALKELGVNVGYVSAYDEQLKLGPNALEQILELINGLEPSA